MAVTSKGSRKSSRVAAKEVSKPKESNARKPKKTMSVAGKPEKKKKQPAGARPPHTHPSYFQMAVEAIASLKERTGSSRQAIAKYIEAHYKSELPAHFKKLLTNQLRILSEKGKLVQVKGSFKLTDELKKSSEVKAIKAVSKPLSSSSVKPTAAKKPKPAEQAHAKKTVPAKSPKPKGAVPAKSPKAKAAKIPKAKPAAKPKPKPVSKGKSAPTPAPPASTPKVQKTASIASIKKEKPSSSKVAKSKPVKTSTPAKSTPAPRKSPRAAPPAASKKTITNPPPKKKKKTAGK